MDGKGGGVKNESDKVSALKELILHQVEETDTAGITTQGVSAVMRVNEGEHRAHRRNYSLILELSSPSSWG